VSNVTCVTEWMNK